MPLSYPPWDSENEPTESSIKNWMLNIYGKFQPVEQARWNESNIDSLFHAGEQRFINSYFNFYPQFNYQNFSFNFIQQPCNMVTGYQRQHRKSINYTPIEGSKQAYSDDLTQTITYANNYRYILDKFSKACELSCISGEVLIQPYLDYTDDPINGTLDIKIWEYNSFLRDPYYRNADMSDCNLVWCQQYISKKEGMGRFPEKAELIRQMSGLGNKDGKFYFLPENYNLARNQLLVLSYVWFKSKRNKKVLYNQDDGLIYEYQENDVVVEELIEKTGGQYEVVKIEVPTWRQAVVLNDQLMYLGLNPLGFDECPFIPVFWNRSPELAPYNLRVRSLVRSLRDSQFLLNRRVILNHDISESSLNSGFYRIENAIVNEEELRYSGQGKDIIVKEGNAIADVIQKIVPNAVPPSDLQLADQLVDFIYKVSGVNQELMGMASDTNTGIQEMLRQGAGLITLQKYFDQWDMSLKLLGNLEAKIIRNWSPSKIERILGHEASPEFYARIYSKYDVLVAEGLNTTIQLQQEFRQIMDLNQALGGVLPPRFIIEKSTLQGKDDIIKFMDEQQKHTQAMEQQRQQIEMSKLEAEMSLIYAKSASEMGLAKERDARADSNEGLFEERLSEISQNRSMALKNKIEALQKLVEIHATFNPQITQTAVNETTKMESQNLQDEDDQRKIADERADSNEFLNKLFQKNNNPAMMQESQGANL